MSCFSSHPYFSIDPFGGSSSFVKTVAVGGDRPVVKIFWGDDNIESNSTEIDYTDNTKWDHVFEINASNPVGLGITLPQLMVWILINSTISEVMQKIWVVELGHLIPKPLSRWTQLLLNTPWMEWCYG